MAMPTATAHDFRLPITTEETLRDYLRIAFGIVIPNVQVCENHSTPWRAFCDAYFARYPVVVCKASRGFGGKSYLMSSLALAEATTIKADVNILGGSGEQSTRILEHMQRYWNHDNAPTHMLDGDVKREMSIAWGNKVKALMASQASVRGPHPQRLRIDEVDEVKVAILDAALGQPMGARGIEAQTLLSSTHQYADGTMTEILRRAAKKGWPVHEWCWKETQEPHGWLPKSEIERKRQEVPEHMWRVEYDLQEPSPGSRAIRPAVVDQMFDKSLGVFDGEPHEYIEIEKPDPDGVYATGADWAKEQDWTVVATYRVDCNPAKCVAWERTGRLDWPVMIAMYENRIERFKGRARHDATGIGNVINDYLSDPSNGIVMAGRDRAEMLTRYITACEHGEIIYPFIRFAYSEHKYASVEDVFRTGVNLHLPDSIAAGSLTWSAYKRAGIEKRRARRNPMSGVRGL